MAKAQEMVYSHNNNYYVYILTIHPIVRVLVDDLISVILYGIPDRPLDVESADQQN